MDKGSEQLLKTPLNAWHQEHGGKMADFSGWELPIHYESGILQEHLATRRFGGLFDIGHMARFLVKGSGKVAFLQHVLSSNVEALMPWQAQYTLIPNDTGGAFDDAYLYRFGQDDFLLVVNAANRDKDWDHLQGRAAHFDDVTIEDHTEQLAMIAFQGALSGRILRGLIEGGAPPEPFHNRLSEITLCGTTVRVARTGYTGEPVGFELFIPPDRAEAVWSALLDAGKDQGVLPVGLGARDTLRLEAGFPLFGHELGLDSDGNEIPVFAAASTRSAVSFSERKGNFIGRSALKRQFEQLQELQRRMSESCEALPRRIRPVAVLDKGIARHGDELFVGPKKVGVVTSGTMAPYWVFQGRAATMKITDETERRAIALAYVDTKLQPGQDVELEVRGRRLAGRIVQWHGRSEAPPHFRPIPADATVGEGEPVLKKGLDKAEIILKKSVDNHLWRQQRCINMIPSEMTPSPLVRLLQVSDPVGRYAEHKPLQAAFGQDVYYYQGTELIEWVEERLNEQLAEYLGCSLIESRTISGQMANQTVFSGMVDYRNRTDRRSEPGRIRLVFNNQLAKGGHLSSQPMGALRDYIAKDPVTERFAVVNFPIREDNPYKIDVEETSKLLDQVNPELIIFGKSMVLHPEPVAEIRRMVESRRERPIIMYDMAHVLGLVGNHFQHPFAEGADIVTGSTHKTFFGTQRGMIATNFSVESPEFDLWKAIQRRAFPGHHSNHHLGTMLGLLLAAVEMNTFKEDYQRQVISNAKAFARALVDEGVRVEGDPAVDYSETHQVLVRVGYSRGCQVAEDLEHNNIIVNYQALPGDESFTSSSGLRLGVSEMTRFGMKEADFQTFAPLFAEAVRGKKVGDEVARLRQDFLTMHYCFDSEALETMKQQLLRTF
ncbi:MAG: glycine cleavage system aminomethyltransferase GcvT [Pirellulaceae bacterium]|nr:glycine cleavage system aminomethyltransferase GcvT [Pirellulaceae bacterium]